MRMNAPGGIVDNETYNLTESQSQLVARFGNFIENDFFPCVAAKAALSRDQISFFVAGHMACPKDDSDILKFIYDFVDRFRTATTSFHTACVIFEQPTTITDEQFDGLLWNRLQGLADLDAVNYSHDKRVSVDPMSADFSFSLKEEAFYVVGLNPSSSRASRRFESPALIFNAHAQFEQLRALGRYDKMKNIIRKRDMASSGSINPTLEDFGVASEVYQYSGMRHDAAWKCPLNFA